MILIDDILVSHSIIENEFVCNLNACKGACCLNGDEGAPVTKSEIAIIEENFEKIKPFLTEEGIETIEKAGFWYEADDKQKQADESVSAKMSHRAKEKFRLKTIENKACVFIAYDEKGVALCGIENAQRAGALEWKKPISCHLYPIRIDSYNDFEAINYYEWDLCSAACELGKQLKMPVYKFLKEPIVRKYGEEFFKKLDAAAEFENTKGE